MADAVRLLVRELGDTPLIGFAGAPFTLASYLVEGGPSRNHERTKALMHAEPDTWHALCSTPRRHDADVPARPGRRRRRRRAALRLLGRRALGARLPRAGAARTPRACCRGSPTPACRASTSASAPASCWAPWARRAPTSSGVDWRLPLDVAAARVGPGRALQGNLDPALLFAGRDVVDREVRRILAEGATAEGHVFNLGHGVLPETDPDVLARVVDLVHEHPCQPTAP